MTIGIAKASARLFSRSPRLKAALSLFLLALLLATALAISFWSMVADPSDLRFLLLGDAWLYAGPNLFFTDYVIHEFGEFPMWNPLMLSGHPFAANPQSFVFYPPNLLRSLLTFDPTPVKTHTGINVMIFLHLLFAGVTTFYLGRKHALSNPASFVAAIAFMLSAASTTRAIGHWYFHNSVAWLPLLLLLANLGVRAPTRLRQLRWFLLTGLLYGVVVLGGFLQLTMLVGITLGAYVILLRLIGHIAEDREALEQKRMAAEESRGRGLISSLLVRLGRLPLDLVLLAMVCGIGVLVSAPMFLPVQEFAAQSGRVNVEGIDWGEKELAFGWGLFKQIVVYSGDWRYESIKCAGAGVLILACLAPFSIRRRDAMVFAAIFAMLLEGGTENSVFLGKILARISPIAIDEPGRGMIVGNLALGMCAGFGLDALTRPLASFRMRTARTVYLIAICAVVLPVLWQGVHPHPVIDVFPAAFVLPAALAALLAPSGWLRRPVAFGALAALLVTSEVVYWNVPMLKGLVGEKVKYQHLLDDLSNRQTFWDDNHRVAYELPNTNLYKLDAAINGYDPLQVESVRRVTTIQQLESEYAREIPFTFASALNPRGNLFLKRSFWLARQYVQGPLPPRERLFPPATTVFLDVPPGMEVPVPKVGLDDVLQRSFSEESTWVTLFDDPNQPIVILPGTDPESAPTVSIEFAKPPLHASLVIKYQADGPLSLIPAFVERSTGRAQPGFRYQLNSTKGETSTVELPVPDFDKTLFVIQTRAEAGQPEFRLYQLRIALDRSDETQLIDIVRRTANTVQLKVGPLPEPRILNFIDAYYPGWSATINGKSVPIIRSNDAFKAVVVPAGTHIVTFEFRPPRVFWGLVISLNTFVFIGIALTLLAVFTVPVSQGKVPAATL